MDNQQVSESSLRPKKLGDYIGQTKIIKTLEIFIKAIKQRGIVSEHLLFYGPPGIGKTTLAYVIANELSGKIRVTSGAAIERSGDLAAILTNLKDNDILFIDEIHRLPKNVEEMLYPVLEEYFLDIIIGKGPSARTVRLPIPKITIIGSTTKLALLSAPLRDRFGLILRLNYYNEKEMIRIVLRSSKLLNLKITEEAAGEIAKRSRRTPRIANRILKRTRDLIETQREKIINKRIVSELFNLLDIDDIGLSDIDQKYLETLAIKFNQIPVGVSTIASSLSEDKQTIEDFIEPYLLQIGFIKKTSRGRIVTPRALTHLKIKPLNRVNKTKQDRLL